MIKIHADQERREGYFVAAPDVFDLDDDGIVMLLRDEIESSEREHVDESARSYPVAALRTRADVRGRPLARLENTAQTEKLMKYATCARQGMSGNEDRALFADAVVLGNGRHASSSADLTDADPSRRSPLIRCRG